MEKNVPIFFPTYYQIPFVVLDFIILYPLLLCGTTFPRDRHVRSIRMGTGPYKKRIKREEINSEIDVT